MKNRRFCNSSLFLLCSNRLANSLLILNAGSSSNWTPPTDSSSLLLASLSSSRFCLFIFGFSALIFFVLDWETATDSAFRLPIVNDSRLAWLGDGRFGGGGGGGGGAEIFSEKVGAEPAKSCAGGGNNAKPFERYLNPRHLASQSVPSPDRHPTLLPKTSRYPQITPRSTRTPTHRRFSHPHCIPPHTIARLFATLATPPTYHLHHPKHRRTPSLPELYHHIPYHGWGNSAQAEQQRQARASRWSSSRKGTGASLSIGWPCSVN